jgi:hypothetical protein
MTDVSTVTTLSIRDRTNAERQRRFRERRKQAGTVTVDAPARNGAAVITTSEMCSLAARLSDGRATVEDLRLADRLIMALVTRLPPNSTLKLGADVPG